MKIVADENMPDVEARFRPFGEVVTLPGRRIRAGDLRDADALLVRSVTLVDEDLLAGSKVRFVGTATIGTDHVDLDYLHRQGIAFSSAPGCNANAVVNYVLACLCTLDARWLEKRVAIFGCGNVGGRLYRCLRRLGVQCLCYDPFLNGEQLPDRVEFAEAISADILCLHTPLTSSGPHPTRHMFNAGVLDRLHPGALLLNAGRGAVVDNRALRERLAAGADLRVVLDVWEPEPDIDIELLHRVALGTPHSAGYSREGKVNGTNMICAAFCHWLGVAAPEVSMPPAAGCLQLQPGQGLADAILAAYPVARDHSRLLAALPSGDTGPADPLAVGWAFDDLRKHYPERREFSCYRVTAGEGAELAPALARQLAGAGFQVAEVAIA